MKVRKFRFRFTRKSLFRTAMILAGIALIATTAINFYISQSAKDALYDDPSAIPHNRVGLLLGTAKHMNNNALNPYYQFRVNAAARLYKAGKIEFILVSGDNSKKNYNEPLKFKIDLIAQGIPANKIFMDYAGFRTLASIVRAQKVFGLDRFTIISQKHHNERALFLARQHHIDAVAFNAEDVYGKNAVTTHIREFFARAKAVLDIIFNVEPKFLGKPVKIQ